MDSLTQAALGAAIGQAGFRRLGRRASFFGALCGTLPDLDVFLSGGDPWRYLLQHRGASHSLLVLPVVAVPVGWLGWRLFGRRGRPRDWVHLAFWALVTHPLLDVCTTYGTQLLAPVTRKRFAVDCISIVDPLYTLPLLAALVLGLRKSVPEQTAARWARVALAWGVCLIGIGGAWTLVAQATFHRQLEAAGFVAEHVRTPVPFFFPVLRHGAAVDAEGRIAVTTVVPWAADRTEIVFVEPVQTPRSEAALASPRGQLTQWFADDLLSVTAQADGTLWFRDHRYGMFTDPTWTPFQTVLPATAPAEALERGGRPRDLDPAAEWAAGWALVRGKRD